MPERYPDWPIRLNKYIASTSDKEFKMGTFDCCTFASDAVKAITGVDPMKEFRGKYDSFETSDEVLKEIGAGSLYRTLWKKFGPAIPGSHGQVGDVVFYEGSCGIMIGRFGLFLGEGGFAYIRISLIQRAFRIGTKEPING